MTDHIGQVRKNLTRQVLNAIDAAPCSLRALAREAGIGHTLLIQLQQRAFNATPELAAKIATALERWGARCVTAARMVRAAARRVPNPRTRRTP